MPRALRPATRLGADRRRDWATENRFGNVTTPQFIQLAERDSGLDLQTFFTAWLYTEGKPTSW